jgi:hypothetical protein
MAPAFSWWERHRFSECCMQHAALVLRLEVDINAESLLVLKAKELSD